MKTKLHQLSMTNTHQLNSVGQYLFARPYSECITNVLT